MYFRIQEGLPGHIRCIGFQCGLIKIFRTSLHSCHHNHIIAAFYVNLARLNSISQNSIPRMFLVNMGYTRDS
jgi:hypothetical protein